MRYFSPAHNRKKNLRPPDLYEYYVDNFWFKTVDLEDQKINEPLRGSHQADIIDCFQAYVNQTVMYFRYQLEKAFLAMHGSQVECLKNRAKQTSS